MPDEDVITDDELEPAAVEAEEPEVDAEAAEEAEPEVYTREQLAELLPHFDQFATHPGEEAFRQYGQSYGNARSFISSGGHREPQDPSVYQGMGLDPSEVAQPEQAEEDAGPQIWGAPWELPGSWDEYIAYAQSDSPEQRRLAAYGVLQSEGADLPTKQWFYNQWAAADPHGAAAYIQQSTMSAAEQRMAEIEARVEARIAAADDDLRTRNASDLLETAKAQVKGLEDHAPAVLALWNERCENEPSFADRFLHQPRAEQIKELRRLTIIAAAEAAPARQAAQAAAGEETTDARLRARTETSRTNGNPDTEGEAALRAQREQLQRIGRLIT